MGPLILKLRLCGNRSFPHSVPEHCLGKFKKWKPAWNTETLPFPLIDPLRLESDSSDIRPSQLVFAWQSYCLLSHLPIVSAYRHVSLYSVHSHTHISKQMRHQECRAAAAVSEGPHKTILHTAGTPDCAERVRALFTRISGTLQRAQLCLCLYVLRLKTTFVMKFPSGGASCVFYSIAAVSLLLMADILGEKMWYCVTFTWKTCWNAGMWGSDHSELVVKWGVALHVHALDMLPWLQHHVSSPKVNYEHQHINTFVWADRRKTIILLEHRLIQ